jgi:hypothetical protein
MGDVYKARDKRLDRIVALKHSKSEFTARFEREARTAGAFNRKYICQLYDVGPNFLVMEPIDGVPLKGPLPVEKAVVYAGQILEALDAAHRKGDTIGDRLDTIGSYIPADAENIRALARIAEIHERRLEAIEGDQPQRSPSRRRDAANFAAGSGDCLAQDPDERFQNALDMKRDLARDDPGGLPGGPPHSNLGGRPFRYL